MDRVPELYIGFLGVLKTGAVAQPLFSAFGDESLLVRLSNAETTAVITQKKHAPKVRKILDKMRQDPSGPGWMKYGIRKQAEYPDVVTDSYLHSMMMAGIVAAHETTAAALNRLEGSV